MPYGQGSVTQDKRNGKWLARFRGPDGRQHSKSFDRKTDARAFLSTMKADRIRGTWIDPRGASVRFDEWAAQWFESRHRLGASARARDESLLRNHILPEFNRRPLGGIGPLDVRAWVNELVAKGLSPRTIQPTYRIFTAIMRSAVQAKLIPDLPAPPGLIQLPTVERRRERFLTEQEVERLALSIDPRYRVLIFAASYTGMRWGELAGLKRCFFLSSRSAIQVAGSLERVGGSVTYKERPKSDAGRRTITLPPFLVQMIEEHLSTQEVGEWVFTTPNGAVMRESNFRREWSGRNEDGAIHRAGLAPLTFHDLRHTHAAWLVRDGLQPLALQRRLGHKDIRTTMNVYGHLFPNFEEEIVRKLDERRAAAILPDSGEVISLHSVRGPEIRGKLS